jgi:hypothetical protein
MALIEDIAVNVLLEAPDCPSTVAEHAIRRAARELCSLAGIWRTTVGMCYTDTLSIYDVNTYLGLAPVPEGTQAPSLHVDYEPEFVDIISVAPSNGSAPLKVMTQAQLNNEVPGWRSDFALTPSYYINYTGEANAGQEVLTPPHLLGGAFEADGDGLFRLVPTPTSNSDQATIADFSLDSAGAVITFDASHSFALGDRVRLLGFEQFVPDVMSGWQDLVNLSFVIIEIVDVDQIRINLDNTTTDPVSGWDHYPFNYIYALTQMSSPPRIPGSQFCKRIDLDLRVTVQPSRTATAIPNSVLRFYEETIISGALAYVLRMPNTPWRDKRLGDKHGRDFTLGIAKAEGMAEDENVKGIVRRVKYGGL